MCNAVYGTFIPVYLDNLGFSRSLIGTLLALGPFIAIIAQPIWGIAGDRSAAKNSILKLMLLGTSITIILYPLSSNYYYLVFIIAAFTFFQTSINPMSDAITLEYISNTGWKYGPIRLAGTVGYAVMSVIAGMIAKQNIYTIFPLYFFITVLSLASVFRIPVVKGHQSEGKRFAFWNLFKNRELVILMGFNLVIQTTLGIYYSFFPIYYRHLGASNTLLGLSMFISAASEIPFLLFADRILDKFGIKATLISSAAVMGIRWLLLNTVTGIYPILLINVMHGFSYVVFTYCLAVYISKEIPRELRASGQTLSSLVGIGISRVIGSILGGLLSDRLGIGTVFLCSSIINFASIALFAIIIVIGKAGEQKGVA